jgi:hypothetical protein
MPNQIILDNWTLQEVKDLYLSGLSNENASKILIDRKNDSHSYQDLSNGFIQVEALFNFLQNLILRDTIIVDEQFTSAWDQNQSLKKLEQAKILKSHDFKKPKIFEVRKAIVDQACVTSSITEVQQKNEKQYQENGTTHDPLMSQIIWGGAGMFARSQVYETFYMPHPLRRYAFQQTPILARDAVDQTLSLIQSSRTRLFHYQNNLNTGQHATFSLPALMVKIIQESNNFNDLLEVSLQLREEYEDLRSWLKQFQIAIESDDPKKISKYSKTLKSVQKNIESKYSPNKYGDLSLELDLFTLSLSVGFPISINGMRNKFGIRSTLNNLILTKAGTKSLGKFFQLFGENNSSLSQKINTELFMNHEIAV